MKFKLDENLGDIGRDILERDGHDVATVTSQNLNGAVDQSLYEICRDEGRVLITLDHDFGHTLRFPAKATAGIVVLECRGRISPLAIRSLVSQIATLLRTTAIDGDLWIVERGRIRIRQSRDDPAET